MDSTPINFSDENDGTLWFTGNSNSSSTLRESKLNANAEYSFMSQNNSVSQITGQNRDLAHQRSQRDEPSTSLDDRTKSFTSLSRFNEMPKMDKETGNLSVREDNKDDLIDPNSLPNSPYKVSFQDVASATTMIKGGVKMTPCGRSNLSDLFDTDIYFKREYLQHTGSFKERGARNALLRLSETEKRNGVIAASLGNHSQGLAYQAARLGIPCSVVMPTISSIMKVKKCKNYGANVIINGKDMTESTQMALKIAKNKKLTFISAYDHPHVISGQGSIGIEICEQVKDFDAVIVPVGGGGLLAGIATAIKTINKNIKVIGVESQKAQSMSRSLERGTPTPSKVGTTLADGLAVGLVGYNAFVSAATNIDKMIVVTEDWIALAILKFVEVEKCVIEGAGAVGLAAFLSGQLDEFRGKRIVFILTGGNIDTPVFGRCLEQGLVKEGRILKFEVILSDRPGGLSSLCEVLRELGVQIKDVQHERPWISDVHSAKVQIICETRDLEHSYNVKCVLQQEHNAVFYDLPYELV